VAVGDFNGDGHPDLAVTDSNGMVSVLRGKGDGTFQTPPGYTSHGGTRSMAVGDFNGDGHLDLAVTDYDSGVNILLANGDGSFQAVQTYLAGFHPSFLAVGDFNGDGYSDIAAMDSGNGTLSILPDKGDGTFPTHDSYAVGNYPISLAVGDFSGDGKLDFAVIHDRMVSIWLGNGDGTFQNAYSSIVGIYPLSVAVGDFSRDGHLDLAVTWWDGTGNQLVSILPGNGDGTFQAAQSYGVGPSISPNGGAYFGTGEAVGDFNGDGNLDLAVAGPAVNILMGNGDGTFQAAQSYAAGDFPASLVVGDFDGDGHLDLAVLNAGYAPFQLGNVSVLLGNGDGTFKAARSYAPGSFSGSVAVGDFNGDGHLDMAVDHDNGTVSVLRGKGDGTFQSPQDYALNNDLSSLTLAVGDFNGDGDLDLVVAGYGEDHRGTVSVLLGNGDGTFQAPQSYTTGLRTNLVAVGDFNGHPDLVISNLGDDLGNNSGVSILLGNGDGSFQAAQTYLAGFHPSSMGVGDFNGDGFLDLAEIDASGGTLSILLGKGDGTFQIPQSYAIGNNPTSVVTGDFNGDGHLDLAIAGHDPSYKATVSVLLGNGDGTFQAARTYGVGGYLSLVAAGDFNRDGNPDLAVFDSFDGTVSILLAKGDGTFQAVQSYSVGTFPSSMAVGDLNGDGFPDLAITTASGVTVLLNAADWGGGGAGAPPPRRPAFNPPVLSATQAESVGAVPLLLSLTELPPSATPQSPLEMERGQPDHASRPVLSVRLAQDALFEKWNDGVLDVLANAWR
jgi:hypothetical protein